MNKTKLKASEIKALRDKMYLKQDGFCLVCSHSIDVDYAVLDHCHLTGHIRAVIHRDCNILLGKVENYTRYKGKRMATESRVGVALEGLWEYMNEDYTDNPLHYTWKTPKDKLRIKYTKLYKRSKRAETKAKYRKLIEEL